MIEFLAFTALSNEDKTLFEEFLEQVQVIGIESTDSHLIQTTIALRKKAKLKLPDAIIAATAIAHKATLITQDHDFHAVKEVTLLEIK